MILRRFIVSAMLAASVVPAQAHTGGSETSGFVTGIMHPMAGLDHVLAMLAVGLLASLLGGRALWAVPASVVATMLAAAMLTLAGIETPAIEVGILVSVVLLGSVVAAGKPFPLSAAMTLVGVLAVFHGSAHGAEMPAGASAIFYGAGFVTASLILHGVGLLSGLAAQRHTSGVRFAGAAISCAGLLLAMA